MKESAREARRIAFLGTGIMGSPMARHLSAHGHEIFAWDACRDRLRELESRGLQVCDTADAAVDQAEVIVTMLPDAAVTEAVMQDVLGEFRGLWIQSATVGTAGTARLLELARSTGTTLIDCPLLGTKSSAEAAQLTALASGPEALEAECRALLSAFSPRVLWLGAAGAGSRLKLVMNNWVIGLTLLTAETMSLSEGLGFSGQTFLDLIADGPLDVEQAHIKGEMMQRGEFPPALPLRLASKDAGLIAAAAREAGLNLPLGRTVAQAMHAAEVSGHGDLDMSAVYLTIAPAAVKSPGTARPQ